jgi:hypothetical protein
MPADTATVRRGVGVRVDTRCQATAAESDLLPVAVKRTRATTDT